MTTEPPPPLICSHDELASWLMNFHIVIVTPHGETKYIYYLWNSTSLLYESTHPGILKRIIFNNAINMLKSDVIIFNQRMGEIPAGDMDTLGQYTKVIGRYETMIFKLGVAGFRNNVFELFREKCLNKYFEHERDKICELIPCNDGFIYNMFTGERIQRNPTDFYTHCFNGNPNNVNKEAFNAVLQFFIQLMCGDNELATYLIGLLAAAISGDMVEKFFIIGIGYVGNNGKTTLANFLHNLLGKSYHTAANGIFLIKEKAIQNKGSDHDAHLVPLYHARVSIQSETDNNGTLHSTNVKMISGNDLIIARPMYEIQPDVGFRTRTHLILFCNSICKIDPSSALFKRARVVPFDANFVDPTGRQLKANEYPVLPNMEELINSPEWLNALVFLLIEAGKYYLCNQVDESGKIIKRSKSLIIPHKVKVLINKCFVTDLPTYQFVQKYFVNTNNARDKISATTMYDIYSCYTELKYRKSAVVFYRELKGSLLIRHKEIDHNSYYVGFRVKTEQELIQDIPPFQDLIEIEPERDTTPLNAREVLFHHPKTPHHQHIHDIHSETPSPVIIAQSPRQTPSPVQVSPSPITPRQSTLDRCRFLLKKEEETRNIKSDERPTILDEISALEKILGCSLQNYIFKPSAPTTTPSKFQPTPRIEFTPRSEISITNSIQSAVRSIELAKANGTYDELL